MKSPAVYALGVSLRHGRERSADRALGASAGVLALRFRAARPKSPGRQAGESAERGDTGSPPRRSLLIRSAALSPHGCVGGFLLRSAKAGLCSARLNISILRKPEGQSEELAQAATDRA